MISKKCRLCESKKLFKLLMEAENCRIIFLTGTPIINYPNELGIMFNMLRGNIKAFNLLLNIKNKSKINQKFFEDFLYNTHLCRLYHNHLHNY